MEEIEFDSVSKAKSSIIVRNAYKTYTPKNTILNGLDLTVPAGGIYGLLGPSGCGKTTLLNCIAGQLKLDCGSIWINAKKRSEIGFMPQAVSLHESMSIFENFFFYGYVFGMSSRAIQARAIDLITLLDLPSGHRIVGDLSGGQRRRISMAVAIIHDPKLMILDEPTAGLDPILSHSVWQNLKQFASAGKSIIVTTHYIQEVNDADMVGVMRNGVILSENSPQAIISNCHCNTIEEAYLLLSQKQECEEKKTDNVKPLEPFQVKYEEDDKLFSTKKFKAVLYKNAKQTRREYPFQILLMFLPVVSSWFFCTAIGRYPQRLKLAIVNEETNCNMYERNGCFLDSDSNVHISCLFLEALKNKTYEPEIYETDAKAWDGIRRSRAWGLLHFKRNYTNSLISRFNMPHELDEETILEGFVETRLDSSNFIISEITLKHDLVTSMLNILDTAMENCNMNPKILRPPLSITTVWPSNNANFVSYVASTFLILMCFSTPSLAASLQMFSEKSQGILERMRITGVSLKEIISVVILLQLITIVIQTLMIVSVMFWLFDHPMRGHWVTLFSLAAITGISGVLYGKTFRD
ncbi:hypothetical protein V9T40_005461 [Parthenolecanium corni]|uniref:ABC transporter domain-containing protein n=1 Tax=Parthenolecanium corni TaxID=536013 RepID=A0AAN9Y3L8_9HEMI